LGVDQSGLGLSVVKDIGHGIWVKTGVNGVQNGAARGYAKSRFALGGSIGQQCCYYVTALNTDAFEGAGQSRTTGVVLCISDFVVTISHCRGLGEDMGCTAQMRQRRQGHVIGGCFV
jgi:hypothetical protein